MKLAFPEVKDVAYPGFSSKQGCASGKLGRGSAYLQCASESAYLRENFLLIKKYFSAERGHPLHEPYRLKHFLLRGNPYRPSAELAKLKFNKRGMLAPKVSWTIKSVMGQRPLGLLCFLW